MKKFVLVVFALAVLYYGCYYQDNYTRKDCEVVKINNGVVTIEDQKGWLWNIETDDLEVGDVVDLKMHTNHTDSIIADDIIKDIIKK